ncbi:MAG: DUF3105 domain-containing protein [Candidatus Yanofskybacteria bacterium]|nr:DUF3105 domain-containing protein [Candidatus Yanofskybacteria bacterium]
MNEYELKKEQREKEAQTQQAKIKMRKIGRAVIYFVVLVLVGFGIYKLMTRNYTTPPGQFYEAQSREHIDVGVTHPAYNSNPPSGGWHYGAAAQTGIYDKELPDEQIIHNLEHGHIWFAYKPDLATEQIEALANIAKDYSSRIIMTSRATNDSPIAVVAWEHVYKLDKLDQSSESQIRSFVNAYRNIAGPERNIPDSGFGDFRGKTNLPSVSPSHVD